MKKMDRTCRSTHVLLAKVFFPYTFRGVRMSTSLCRWRTAANRYVNTILYTKSFCYFPDRCVEPQK